MAIGDLIYSDDYYNYYSIDDTYHYFRAEVISKTEQTYGSIQASVTIGRTKWYLQSLNGCFTDCINMHSSPDIPGLVEDMTECFENCTSLINGPSLIPPGVTIMDKCFSGCSSLVNAPYFESSTFNYDGLSMRECFKGCSSLETAPNIPYQVRDLTECFESCTSLSGYIYTSCGLDLFSRWTDIFKNTSNDIKVIVLYSNEENTTAINKWKEIADAFSNVSVPTTYQDIPTSFTFDDYIYSHDSGSFSVKVHPDKKGKDEYHGIYGIINGVYYVEDMTECFKDCSRMWTFEYKWPYTGNEETRSGLNLSRCFEGCTSLYKVTSIPTGVTNMTGCFTDCISLKSAPKLASTVSDTSYCFDGCTSLTSAPTIPNSVTNLYACFRKCTSLKEAPTISSNARYIQYCFAGCSSLTTAPAIPQLVSNMIGCFMGCVRLRGNITVYNTPAIPNTNAAFENTTEQLFIINGTPSSETIKTRWQDIVSRYSNVHFEADDNPDPSIVMDAGYPMRVTAKGSTEASVSDPWILMQYTVTHSDDILPDGWSALGDTLIVKDEATGGDLLLGSGTYPTLIKSTDIVADDVQYSANATTSDIYTIQLWIDTHDIEKHDLSLNVRNVIYNKTNPVYGTDTPKSYNTYILNAIISKVYPTMDFHSGGEGMGIGTYATEEGQLRIGMDPTWVLDPEVEKDLRILNAMLNLGWITKPKPTIDLTFHGSWVDSGTVVNGHKVYKSDGSHHVTNAWDTAKITFTGFETFSIFIRSYGENNYDYVLVSTLNNNYLANRTSTSSMRNLYNDSTYTKAHTRGKASSTTYEEVIFDNLDKTQEYYFYVIYQKDSSGDSNDDRGYFYLGQEEGEPW